MLDRGRVVFAGTADEVASYYEANLEVRAESAPVTVGDGITIDVLDVRGANETRVLHTGQPATVRVHFRNKGVVGATATLSLNRLDGLPVLLCRCPEVLPTQGSVTLNVRLPSLDAAPGSYFLHVSARDPHAPDAVYEDASTVIQIAGEDPYLMAAVTVPHADWHIEVAKSKESA